MMWIWLIISACILCCIYSWWSQVKGRQCPPGPMPLPLIGTIYYHGIRLSPKTLTNMSKIYGPVFSIFIGRRQFIVLNGCDVLKEAMQRPYDLGHRGVSGEHTWDVFDPNIKGIFRRDYDTDLIKLRSKAMAVLRHASVRNEKTSRAILQEGQILMDTLSENNGSTFSPSTIFEYSLTNAMMRILFDKKATPDVLESLSQHSNNIKNNLLLMFVMNHFRVLQHIPYLKRKLMKLVAGLNASVEFTANNISDVLDYAGYNESSCFARSYAKMAFGGNLEKAKECDDLQFMLSDFLIAGIEGMVASLEWSVIFLANRPHIQKKLKTEISEYIEKKGQITIFDYKQLAYLEAVIMEVMRYSNMAHTFVHMSNLSSDVQFRGYTIPKQSVIIYNNYSVNSSTEVWRDPMEFRPERVLTNQGELIQNNQFLPFGAGKRTCVGEVLVRRKLYVFVGMLFQKFSFHVPEGMDQIPEDPIDGIFWRPKPFMVRISKNS